MPALRLVSGVVLLCLAVVALLLVSRRAESSVAPAPASDGELVITGVESQATAPFFLYGGSYRAVWSAWGESPSEPPCTHSVALMSLAADGSSAAVQTLAKSIQVPSTGVTAAVDLANLTPGDYYFQVTSACAWQIQLKPS